jgi:hypothetical protein
MRRLLLPDRLSQVRACRNDVQRPEDLLNAHAMATSTGSGIFTRSKEFIHGASREQRPTDNDATVQNFLVAETRYAWVR